MYNIILLISIVIPIYVSYSIHNSLIYPHISSLILIHHYPMYIYIYKYNNIWISIKSHAYVSLSILSMFRELTILAHLQGSNGRPRRQLWTYRTRSKKMGKYDVDTMEINGMNGVMEKIDMIPSFNILHLGMNI